MVIVDEKYDSRETLEGDQPSTILKFIVRGTDDDRAAKEALWRASPILYDGLFRHTLAVEPLGGAIWLGTVRYELTALPEIGQSSVSYSTLGGSQHITQSIATPRRYALEGKTAPDFGGAIGVARDRVEGVDVLVPKFEMVETHQFAEPDVAPAYFKQLFYLTRSVNEAPFRWFAAGEVLFKGASWSRRGQEAWDFTFHFECSPNMDHITIGDMTGITKLGWEYLWVRYEDVEDEEAHALVKRPTAVYIEQVYPYGNFALLGIGQ